MLVDSIEIFPTKREMGYLKAIHFKIPVLRDYGDFTDVMTIWDYYPDILDEEGNFNGYSPEDDLPDRDMLKEKADEDGNIPVVEEYGEEEKLRLLQLRLARINLLRKEQNLPEMTVEEFLENCRPKQITDESVVLLSSDKNTIHNMKLNPKPFEMIKRGIKTIELRLLDEKRRKIKPGDVIIFTNTEDGRTIRTTVLKLHVFDTFQQLYDTLPLLKCGYTSKDVASASASDMMEYYSEEEQRKYGVVGIEITNDLQIILQSSGV